MRKEDAAGTANVRCGEMDGMSLQSRIQVVVSGESGQNELLREPLALVGMHSSTRLVKNLVKYWRIPMFPAQFILPSSPGMGSMD